MAAKSKNSPISIDRLSDTVLLCIMPLVLVGCIIYYFFYAKDDSAPAIPTQRSDARQATPPPSGYASGVGGYRLGSGLPQERVPNPVEVEGVPDAVVPTPS